MTASCRQACDYSLPIPKKASKHCGHKRPVGGRGAAGGATGGRKPKAKGRQPRVSIITRAYLGNGASVARAQPPSSGFAVPGTLPRAVAPEHVIRKRSVPQPA
jgi:hypothetical protein